MDKIFIDNLRLKGILGINPEERVQEQEILINLVLFTDTREAAESDKIEDAVNYRTLTKRVIDHVQASSDFLVEKLVNDIARIILSEFPIARVRVRVDKPGALRFTDTVGIEIERTYQDYH